jgi:hypothetical protein
MSEFPHVFGVWTPMFSWGCAQGYMWFKGKWIQLQDIMISELSQAQTKELFFDIDILTATSSWMTLTYPFFSIPLFLLQLIIIIVTTVINMLMFLGFGHARIPTRP